MPELMRVLRMRRVMSLPESDPALAGEWLVTNGLGGYASRNGDRRTSPAAITGC